MLLRVKVKLYKWEKIEAIKKFILDKGLAQNVELASDITGDFNDQSDGHWFLRKVQELQREHDCTAYVEVS